MIFLILCYYFLVIPISRTKRQNFRFIPLSRYSKRVVDWNISFEKGGTSHDGNFQQNWTTKMKERSAWIFERLISRRRFRGSSKRPPYISKYIYIYISEIENRISAFLHGLIIFHWRRPIKPFNRAGNWLPGRRSARSDRDSFVIDRIDRPLSSLCPRSSKDYDRYTDTDAYTRTRNSFRKRFSLSERVRISGVMLDISRMERMPRKSLAV